LTEAIEFIFHAISLLKVGFSNELTFEIVKTRKNTHNIERSSRNLSHDGPIPFRVYCHPHSWISMIKFFVLDVLLRRVVAVSSDPAPDSAFAPSFFGRPSGQLP
jgi:hypothetical protein